MMAAQDEAAFVEELKEAGAKLAEWLSCYGADFPGGKHVQSARRHILRALDEEGEDR